MDPGFDISLNTPEDATSYEAKGHFLESLGLSERHLLGESFSGRVETLGDDGVVLSSMPDDLGFPSPGKAPDRSLSLSFSISEQKGRETALAISLPAEEATQPEPAEATNKSTGPEASQAEGPDETLHLQCPECRGSLVLSRRHLGIEGTCVWCQTPIVAAESASDGQVCIFPILGHAPEEPKSAIRLTIPAADSKSLHHRDRAPELRPEPSTEEATVPVISEAEDRLMVPGPEEPLQPNSKGAAREGRGGEIDHQNLASPCGEAVNRIRLRWIPLVPNRADPSCEVWRKASDSEPSRSSRRGSRRRRKLRRIRPRSRSELGCPPWRSGRIGRSGPQPDSPTGRRNVRVERVAKQVPRR